MKNKAKFLSLILSFVMVITLIPFDFVSAATAENNDQSINGEDVTVEAETEEKEVADKVVVKKGTGANEDVSSNARYGISGLYYRRLSSNQIYVYWNDNYSTGYDVTIYNYYNYNTVASFRTSSPDFTRWLPAGKYTVEITDDDYNYNEITVSVPGMKIQNFNVLARSGNSIRLSWNQVQGVDGYQIWKLNRNTGNYFLRYTCGPNATSYMDKGLYANNTYTYKIRAFNTVNGVKKYGNFSPVRSDTTGIKTTSFTGRVAYKTAITLKWSKLTRASGYNIYRSTKLNGPYKKVKTINNNTTFSYTDRTVNKGTTYYYKIQAYRFINNQIYRGNLSRSYKVTTFLHARPNLVAMAPSEDIYDSYIVNDFAIVVKNNSGYTMTIQHNAYLYDANYYDYDRNIYVTGWAYKNGATIYKNSTVSIPPNSTRIIFFHTNNATWYDNNTEIECKFRFDGLLYNLNVSPNEGYVWWR